MMLIGPPPIPRKDERIPNRSPMARENKGDLKFFVAIFAFFMV